MESYMRYGQAIIDLLSQIMQDEEEHIERAAELLADAVEQRDIFHVIGTGAHGSIVAEEMLWRVGGLACVNSIIDPSVNLLFGASRSGIMDQTACNCAAVLDANRVNNGDTLIIVSSAGINAYSVELVKECRKRGIKTISITSRFGLSVGKKPEEMLMFLSDCFIDNHMPYGDTALLSGTDEAMGPASTVLNTAIANMLLCQTIDLLRHRGIDPPVWKYDACPGGEEFNEGLHARYRDRIVLL